MKSSLTAATLTALLAASLAVSGCSKEYVRGSNDPSIDNPAMSTGLDKEDIQKMLSESLNKMRNSAIMELWRSNRGKDTVAIFPFQNATSEHIDSQLAAALGETETWLVESGVVTVISRERQKEMIAEVEGQHGAVFNPANVAKYGRQLGAKYFVTGKVQAADERTDDARRVQYFLFMQVVEVETSAVRFQHKSYVTKMVR